MTGLGDSAMHQPSGWQRHRNQAAARLPTYHGVADAALLLAEVAVLAQQRLCAQQAAGLGGRAGAGGTVGWCPTRCCPMHSVRHCRGGCRDKHCCHDQTHHRLPRRACTCSSVRTGAIQWHASALLPAGTVHCWSLTGYTCMALPLAAAHPTTTARTCDVLLWKVR